MLWSCKHFNLLLLLKMPALNVYLFSLMSDYEVTLVNDNMQEFYVRFHGPSDST